jgi:ABC-type lipoprotein release transport system permease subunit
MKNTNQKTPMIMAQRLTGLQPLSDIHFNADYNTFSKAQASKPTLYSLLAIAAFLLLLGCINFINLTTAQAAQRAKEIGIRKTMGSSRKQVDRAILKRNIFTYVSGNDPFGYSCPRLYLKAFPVLFQLIFISV